MNNKILIIDDDDAIRTTIGWALESEGYDTAQASNGERALEYLKQNESDLPMGIILDLLMPVMDGATFLRTLEEEFPNYQKIPIIVASANLDYANHIDNSCVVSKLVKPIDLETLYSTVQIHCGSASA